MILPATAALAVVARAAVHGAVKTRLAATIGADDALAVYRALLAHTAAVAAAWPGPQHLIIAGDDAEFRHPPWTGRVQAQAAGGLGARLAALARPLLAAHTALVIIGTDCPTLTVDDLHALAVALTDAPIAFGPAVDGGYWGVALRDAALISTVFADDLPWSQPTLLHVTEERLRDRGFTAGRGPRRDDLDDAADLARAEAACFHWRV